MHGILDWGLGVVRAAQTLQSPALTALVKAVTFLGSEYAYVALLPLVYWCVDERRGMRLGLMVLLSAWLNSFLKVLWRQPRPYDLDPAVALARETTFGLPSGHAQGSATFWGVVGSWLRFPVGLLAAVLVPLVVGLSRVYLGVHFPTDVLAGWALGGLLLAFYFAFGPLLEALLSAAGRRARLIAAAGLSLGLNALYPADTSVGGVVLGLGVGYQLMSERFPFSAATGKAPVRALRLLLGTAGTAALYFGLKAVLPGEGAALYALLRFLRYALIGFWVSAGAPWLFLRLKLVGARSA